MTIQVTQMQFLRSQKTLLNAAEVFSAVNDAPRALCQRDLRKSRFAQVGSEARMQSVERAAALDEHGFSRGRRSCP